MADPVFKKVEFVGTSSVSWSDAVANAVAAASAENARVSWFEVREQRGSVVEGKIHQYQVTVSVGYRTE